MVDGSEDSQPSVNLLNCNMIEINRMTYARPLPKTILLGLLSLFSSRANAQTTASREQILDEGQKVADAQLHAIGDKVSIDWTWGVMEAGYSEFSHVAPKGSSYEQALTAMAEKVRWKPLLHAKVPFHADDFCITQTFLDLYAIHPDPTHLAPVKERMDSLVDHLNETKDAPKLTFWWCDALFMAPPALARISIITKNPKYLDAMDSEYWRTTAALYDRDEHLFFRDARFVHQTDKNGKKIFWSRGNGWVLAGLARVMEFMPKDYSSRSKYESLFKEMSAKLITLQGSDGTWRTSLENPAEFAGSETSGTALFTYAMAWGINNHLLDRQTYVPVVAKAWAALLAARRPDGLPGYSQSEGAAPAAAKADGTQVYTTGGYLLAASELQKLAPLLLPQTVTLVKPADIDAKPTTQPAEPEPAARE